MELNKVNGKHDSSAITPGVVEEAVFRAVDVLNQTLANSQRLRKSRDMVLVDTTGSIDSMAMVNLIVFIEDELAQETGRPLDLTGADPFDEKDLKTLGAMIDALFRKLSG